MQIVIKIPDTIYEDIKENFPLDANVDYVLKCAVSEGTPLPKGHGRLIDVDDLEHITVCSKTRNSGITRIDAPTIIEADKTESEVEE